MTTCDLVFRSGGRERPLVIVRRHGARGLRLSIDPRDGMVRLSLPARAPLRSALLWAADKRDWVEAELAKIPDATPIVPGMRLSVAGENVLLDWAFSHPRLARLVPGALRVGGPLEQMPMRVLRFLKQQALQTLDHETRTLAASNGIVIAKVGIGDPRSCWGSCASSGVIRYNWRLILAPEYVRRATVAHEVAHRVHMNHSREFHALAWSLNGSDPAPARRWLRANGNALHSFGRGND